MQRGFFLEEEKAPLRCFEALGVQKARERLHQKEFLAWVWIFEKA